MRQMVMLPRSYLQSGGNGFGATLFFFDWRQDVPERLQESPTTAPRRPNRLPHRLQDWPKRAPRGFQEGRELACESFLDGPRWPRDQGLGLDSIPWMGTIRTYTRKGTYFKPRRSLKTSLSATATATAAAAAVTTVTLQLRSNGGILPRSTYQDLSGTIRT